MKITMRVGLGMMVAFSCLGGPAHAELTAGRSRITQTAQLQKVDSAGRLDGLRGADFTASREDGQPGGVSFRLVEWYQPVTLRRGVPVRRFTIASRTFRVTETKSQDNGEIEARGIEVPSPSAGPGFEATTLTLREQRDSHSISVVETSSRTGAVTARYVGTYRDLTGPQ